MAVPAAERIGLRVAIGTEKDEVLQTVVRAVAVLVMDLDAELPPTPTGDPTFLAAILLYPAFNEALLEVASTVSRVALDEQKLQGLGTRSRHDVAPDYRLRPTAAVKAKALLALAHRQAAVVCLLDLDPVVALGERVIGRDAEPARVIGDRALPSTDLLGDLRVGKALLAELSNESAGFSWRSDGSSSGHANTCSHDRRT